MDTGALRLSLSRKKRDKGANPIAQVAAQLRAEAGSREVAISVTSLQSLVGFLNNVAYATVASGPNPPDQGAT